MGINSRSDYLVVLVGTYNRLELLKKVIDSIHSQTLCSHEIIVIDGGSTDGTIEYLRTRQDVTSVFQGKLLGASRAYNEVWRQVECKYTCWLSDDTELANGGLDLAVQLLEKKTEIGMVGLKTKDVVGPWADIAYTGALSEYGILNCNHGVLSMDLLRSVGYFNQDYKTYLIDPDLTASVLCTGKKVVMTKDICVRHHREWADENWENKVHGTMNGIDHYKIYLDKFSFMQKRDLSERIRKWIGRAMALPLLSTALMKIMRCNARDWLNLTHGRFISPLDVVQNRLVPYHNVQRIPQKVLRHERNPYKHLLQENV
jgi:glycosyltransferase involved in cell wall biosynthesis